MFIVCGGGMLYGAPNARGDLVIDKKGDVLYTPLEEGVHEIPFGGKGRLSFDSTKVKTAYVDPAKLKTTEEARKSVLGASIEVRSQDASQKNFPTGQQQFKAQGKVFHFEPEGLMFETPATLTLPYESVEGLDDSRINIYYYNKISSMWDVVPKLSQNAENKTITVGISHFSDWVPGISSFRTDESGSIDGGGQLTRDVDPYFGAISLRSNEVLVKARGVDLGIESSFNSDYLYTRYLSTYSGSETSAGQTLVRAPHLKYPYPGVDTSCGWAYNFLYCEYNDYNELTLILPNGRVYDFSQALIAWLGTSSGGTITTVPSCIIEKPTFNTIRILIVEAGYGIDAVITDIAIPEEGYPKTHFAEVSNVNVYNAKGERFTFSSAGPLQYQYDVSGKNFLHYVYSSGSVLQRVEHSDGRAIKIFPYTNSSGTKSLAYVLSSSASMTTLNTDDQFLARRVFDSSERLQYADKLGTVSGFSSSTNWGGA